MTLHQKFNSTFYETITSLRAQVYLEGDCCGTYRSKSLPPPHLVSEKQARQLVPNTVKLWPPLSVPQSHFLSNVDNIDLHNIMGRDKVQPTVASKMI